MQVQREGRPPLPWVESPFFCDEVAARDLTEEQKRIASDFHRDGFVVLPQLVPRELCDRVAAEVDQLFAAAPDGRPVMDAWRYMSGVRQLATLPDALDTLRVLYEREPVPFQTLNFLYGTQQRPHADTLHFNSFPPKFMCGIWVALEDVGPNDGPLFYYRESHRLPEVGPADLGQTPETFRVSEYEDYEERLMNALGLDRLAFCAEKGDALVWASNIVHGGMPIAAEGATRRSQVTHYFFEDCLYYTPLLSDVLRGEFYVRHGLTNIRTGRAVPHRLPGQTIQMTVLNNRRTRLAVHPSRSERFLATVSNVVRGFPHQRVRLGMQLLHRARAARMRARVRAVAARTLWSERRPNGR